MSVIIFGASGMVGQGCLRECLHDPDISVLTISRSATTNRNPAWRQIVHQDFWDYTAIESELSGFDACFFCLGTSSAGMREADYQHVTYDIAIAAAETLCRLNPGMVFVYVSATGADSSEQGPRMWPRVRGRTENALLRLPFKAAYMFRPGMIQPLHGIHSRTRSYRIIYQVMAPVLPLLRRVFPAAIATTESIGRAMIEVARHGASKTILENADILALNRSAQMREAAKET